MNAPATLAQLQAAAATVEFTLDGRSVTGFEGETILSVAKREGVDVPHLCFKEGYRADGNCRACVVEIAGERTLAPSCCRAVAPKMVCVFPSTRTCTRTAAAEGTTTSAATRATSNLRSNESSFREGFELAGERQVF